MQNILINEKTNADNRKHIQKSCLKSLELINNENVNVPVTFRYMKRNGISKRLLKTTFEGF